jgi:hypothetical protein
MGENFNKSNISLHRFRRTTKLLVRGTHVAPRDTDGNIQTKRPQSREVFERETTEICNGN